MNHRPFILFGILISLWASVSVTSLSAQIESPYATIYNHLENLQPDNYHPELSARSFAIDSTSAADYAVMLKKVMDGKGLYVFIEDIPQSPTYFDSTLMKAQYHPFPDELPGIFVRRTTRGWQYPAEVVPAIKKHYEETYPYWTRRLMELLPHSGATYLGLYLWQWIGVVLLLVVLICLYLLFRWIAGYVIRLLGRSNHDLLQNKAKLLNRIASLVSIYFSVLLIREVFPVLELSPRLSWVVMLIFKIILGLMILLIILRVIDVIYRYFFELTKLTESKMDEQLLPVLKRAAQIIFISFWVIYLLTLFNVDVTALLAGISIGGVAIALAAQDTLKNLFGSFTIFMDKPFQIGDWIQFGGVEGTVEEVGFRSTRVRSFENSLVSVPNAKLLDTSVNNYGLRQYRRFKTNIAITYDTPPDSIELFVEGLRRIVELHPATRKEGFEIHLNNMSDSSLDILFYIFFDVANWSEELKARQQILLAIIRLAQEMGIEFAFPSMSIYRDPVSRSVSAEDFSLEAFLDRYRGRIS